LGATSLASQLHPVTVTFTYLNTATTVGADLIRLYLGAFFANSYYLNSRDTFQFMAGLEIPVIPNTFHFMADHIHGQHNFGVSVVGGVFFPTPHFAISAGIQLPNSGTNNPQAAVLELTWI
jgi:hypothetical protein